MTEHPGLVFARVAEEYDRVRPGYPASLVDAACSIGELSPGSEVVEVGCGTGKLTAALVERGLRVDAVDPSPELLEIARDRTRESSVRFHLTRFEDVDLPEHAFAAVFSATAFHWVDPKVGWSKAARLLQPGGLLALLAYFGGSDIEVRARVHAAWREVIPEAANWRVRDEATIWEGANERLGNVSEVWAWLEQRDLARAEAAELFDDVRLAKLAVEREETIADLLAFVRTTSPYIWLDRSRQRLLERRLTELVEDLGGIRRRTVFATLVTARSRTA
jgi:ubiquinone/menaquinone biosynthesis C-methylase UbiE